MVAAYLDAQCKLVAARVARSRKTNKKRTSCGSRDTLATGARPEATPEREGRR